MIYKTPCGEKVSLLGMGNMRLPTVDGGNGPIDEVKAQEIIDYVYASGVNYFDTAYMYHGGHSEKFLGKALKKFPRDSYFLASKMPSMELQKGRSAQEIFEEQLDRCQTDRFDFYLLHNLNEGSYDVFTDPQRGVIDYLLEQKKLGRIGHLGLSSHAQPATLKKFLDTYDFPEFVQIQLNYLDWDFQDAKQQYEIITGHGLPVWVMEPCRGGRLASLSEEADAILKAAQPEKSIASWAFRYLLDLPGVQVILSGMTELWQAEDNVKTFSEGKNFSEEEKEALKKALALFRAKFIVPCTVCHYCDGCPMGLDIPDLLAKYSRYALNPGPMGLMAVKNSPAEKQPSACIACGACTAKCPQNIDIPGIFEKFAEAIASAPDMHRP